MRVALVTGGAGGLGRATARHFAADGMTVVAADIDGTAVQAAIGSIEGTGHRGIQLDVSNETAVAAAFASIEEQIGPIAVLAHFAGLLGEAGSAGGVALADASLDAWERVFAVNARGTFLCLREMARCRRARPVEHGRIITISSAAAQMGGLQTGAGYAASKGAIIGITKSAARELAPFGITVNSIAPGPIDTAMLRAATGVATDAKYTKLSQVPLGRVGTPEELAAAAAFLASPAAAYITGTTLDVNGGLAMN